MTTEHLKIITNALVAVALVVAVTLGAATIEQAGVLMLAVLIPSAGPEVLARVRDALGGPKKPPKGPSVVAVMLVAFGGGAASSACGSPGAAPAASPPCQAQHLSIDACAAEYQTSLLACSTASETRAESEACEDQVRAVFGRPPRARADGGASS